MFLKYWLAVGALGGAVSLLAAEAPRISVVEEIVAKVNGDIITRSELEKTRQSLEAELRKQQPALAGAALQKALSEREAEALRDQIDQLLLVERGKDLNINVDPEVTRRIATIQSESKIADQEKFHEWVHEQLGVPFEDYRQQMKNSIITQRVVGQEVASKVQFPQSELEDYYNKHKAEFVRQEMVFLREILIAPKDTSEAEVEAARKRAKEISDRARRGERFGDLARQYSAADSANQDGEIGASKRGELRKEIEDVVFKENKGYVTEPFRTANGFLILKIEERYAPGQASFEDVKEEINQKLFAPRMQPAMREYLTKLREDAFIEIRAGYVDSGAAPGKDTSWKDPAQLKPETTTKEEVAARGRRRKLLKVIPMPGRTSTGPATPAATTPPAPK